MFALLFLPNGGSYIPENEDVYAARSKLCFSFNIRTELFLHEKQNVTPATVWHY